MRTLRKVLLGFGLVVGVYLIGRAVIEPFVIDIGDPSTYRDNWGGPNLAGVLAVHCVPGVISAVLIGLWLRHVCHRRGRAVPRRPAGFAAPPPPVSPPAPSPTGRRTAPPAAPARRQRR